MKKNFKKNVLAAFVVLAFTVITGAVIVHADAYDPIIGFRTSDDAADTSAHIVGLAPNNFAVFGTRFNGGGVPAAYYFDQTTSGNAVFNIVATSGALGTSNYKIMLDLGGMDKCNVGDLCDHIFPVVTGQSGKFLSNDGTTSSWVTAPTGTVTSIVAGTGLSGGTITTSGTISLPNTGTSGTYGTVTTDAQGRVTAGKRMETYSGTTNGSGVYTVTFGTAYSVAPNIQANLINGTDTQTSRITSISTTGFTVLIRNRTDVVGLLPAYANVSGASVDVLITEK